MSARVGACATVLPLAAHIPSGASACMSLTDALRRRDVGEDAFEVGVRASCGAADVAFGSASSLVASGGSLDVGGLCLTVCDGSSFLSLADAVGASGEDIGAKWTNGVRRCDALQIWGSCIVYVQMNMLSRLGASMTRSCKDGIRNMKAQ